MVSILDDKLFCNNLNRKEKEVKRKKISLRLPDGIIPEKGKLNYLATAKELGISRHTLKKLAEGSLKEIKVETIEQLCNSLDCEPSELFVVKPA